MAVNENDRVSTRRLKQFYDKLKLELASMFKDAKPNYNLMNENKQLGQGYGWNYKGQQFFTYNIGTSARINTAMLIQGFNSIGAFPNAFVYNTLNSVKGYYGSANYNREHELILSSLTGSLIVVPKEITDELINDEWINPNYEFPFDWLNGTFDSDLIALVSPVITFEGHTYQTRLRSANNKDAQSSQVDQYIYEVKIDGGEWTERYMQNDCFAWSFGLQHPLVNIGERFVGDNSVRSKAIVNDAVTTDKIATEAISLDRLGNKLQRQLNTAIYTTRSLPAISGTITQIIEYASTICLRFYGIYSSMVTQGYLTEETNYIKINPIGIIKKNPIEWSYPPYAIARVGLKTDSGYYECFCKMGQEMTTGSSNVNYWTIEPFDNTFMSHLTETNPIIIFNYSIPHANAYYSS